MREPRPTALPLTALFLASAMAGPALAEGRPATVPGHGVLPALGLAAGAASGPEGREPSSAVRHDPPPLATRHAMERRADELPPGAPPAYEGSSRLGLDIPVTPGDLAPVIDPLRPELHRVEAPVPVAATQGAGAAPAAPPSVPPSPAPLLTWRTLAVTILWIAGLAMVIHAFARPRREVHT